jgi:leucyl-tRNA synthetase
MPVDLYIGGADHSVMHLLYARFITKVLQKYGYCDINEPFQKLRHQGMILAEDGSKMSKSKGNVVNPNDVIAEYGADTLRLYEMFMGPLEDPKPWNTKNILGVKRFLEKIILLSNKIGEDDAINYQELILELNKTIKKVEEDIEDLKFNTAISQLMILVNTFSQYQKISLNHFSVLLVILSPFAPFTTQELWEKIGKTGKITQEAWPVFDKNIIETEKISLAVQVNGKTRGAVEVDPDSEESEVVSLIEKDENLKKYLIGDYKKIIYVKNRIINFII